MKKKSPKPTQQLFFLVAFTLKPAQHPSLLFFLWTFVFSMCRNLSKNLSNACIFMLIKCQLLGYVACPLPLDATRNHALTLPWLANLIVSKFLIFPDQPSLQILEKNYEPTNNLQHVRKGPSLILAINILEVTSPCGFYCTRSFPIWRQGLPIQLSLYN